MLIVLVVIELLSQYKIIRTFQLPLARIKKALLVKKNYKSVKILSSIYTF